MQSCGEKAKEGKVLVFRIPRNHRAGRNPPAQGHKPDRRDQSAQSREASARWIWRGSRLRRAGMAFV
jgi:hypothetical protein